MRTSELPRTHLLRGWVNKPTTHLAARLHQQSNRKPTEIAKIAHLGDALLGNMGDNVLRRKGKLAARQGRKATGLSYQEERRPGYRKEVNLSSCYLPPSLKELEKQPKAAAVRR
jgi:hypothetical protein